MLNLERIYQLQYYKKVRAFLAGNDLRQKMLSGGFWLGIGSGSENILRLVRNMILARVLAPESFGLMALVLAFSSAYEAFTNIGIREAVIQYPKKVDKPFINAVFWISSVRCLILYILALISVPWIAYYYGKPEIIPLFSVILLSILFNGFISPRAYVSLKYQNYKRWVLFFCGGGVVGVIASIILGFIFKNVWALVIGFTLESFLRCFFSYVMFPFLPSFRLSKESFYALFRYAYGMFGSPIFFFLYQNLDIFILGKIIESSDLGIYSLIIRFVSIPLVLFGSIINPLIMPMFSNIQDIQNKIFKGLCDISKYIGLIFLPFFTVLICFAGEILTIVYGEIFASNSVIMQILCFGFAIQVQMVVFAAIYLSIGKPEINRNLTLFRFIVFVLIIIPFSTYAGTVGAAIARLISTIIWGMYNLLIMQKLIGFKFKKYAFSFLNSFYMCSFIFFLWVLYNTFT